MRTEAAPPTEIVDACDLCGSTGGASLGTVRDRVHGLPGVFGLVRCSTCGLVRLSPRPVPSGLGFYYPADEYSAYLSPATSSRGSTARKARDVLRASALRALGYPGHNGVLERLGSTVLRRVPSLRRFGAYRAAGFPEWRQDGRALEVGPGNGAFLDALHRNGWQTIGLDLSPAAAEAAQRLYGRTVVLGTLGDDPFDPASFDFVHLRHVIEHVVSPTAALARLRELLAPGGRAYLETPNVAGTGFLRYGERWQPVEAPRHLWLFNPSTLRRAVEQAGLRVLSTQTSAYSAPRWASAFREQDRTGAHAVSGPVVPSSDRWRVRRETVADRLHLVTRPDSGDILGLWAERV